MFLGLLCCLLVPPFKAQSFVGSGFVCQGRAISKWSLFPLQEYRTSHPALGERERKLERITSWMGGGQKPGMTWALIGVSSPACLRPQQGQEGDMRIPSANSGCMRWIPDTPILKWGQGTPQPPNSLPWPQEALGPLDTLGGHVDLRAGQHVQPAVLLQLPGCCLAEDQEELRQGEQNTDVIRREWGGARAHPADLHRPPWEKREWHAGLGAQGLGSPLSMLRVPESRLLGPLLSGPQLPIWQMGG